MGPLLRRKFQETAPIPRFKEEINPPLLLFDLPVQSEPRNVHGFSHKQERFLIRSLNVQNNHRNFEVNQIL